MEPLHLGVEVVELPYLGVGVVELPYLGVGVVELPYLGVGVVEPHRVLENNQGEVEQGWEVEVVEQGWEVEVVEQGWEVDVLHHLVKVVVTVIYQLVVVLLQFEVHGDQELPGTVMSE